MTYVSTRKTKLYTLTDRGHTGVAEDVREFAPTIQFNNPNGICFSKDGFLFTVEQNRVLTFPAAEFFYENPDVAVAPVVKQGELIPSSEESFNHSARVCRVGPDNKLYITLGQPYNVYAPEKYDLYYKWGLGGIVRMDRDGTNREVFAHGVRNSVGMDFNPKDKTLWFTDNQVDGMGDDQPPGELNHATKPGQNFGFPWYGGGHTRTVEYKDQTPPADVVFPVVEEVAHAADLGMMVYTGKMFPKEYQGAIFSAQHGSWNRTVPVGARIMVTKVDADGKAPGRLEALRRRLARRGRRIYRPAGRRRADARRLAARLGRPRRRRLSHHLRRQEVALDNGPAGDRGAASRALRMLIRFDDSSVALARVWRQRGPGGWQRRGRRAEDQDSGLYRLPRARWRLETAGGAQPCGSGADLSDHLASGLPERRTQERADEHGRRETDRRGYGRSRGLLLRHPGKRHATAKIGEFEFPGQPSTIAAWPQMCRPSLVSKAGMPIPP